MPPARVLRLRTQAAVEVGGLAREPPSTPSGFNKGVVAGTRTRPTPVLDAAQMITRMARSLPEYPTTSFGAFYSSAMAGIVTDPTLMLVPIDDQFVVKGYGVVETLLLRNGYLYLLDRHMERLKASCEAIGLELPFTENAVKRIILDTAAASGKLNGQIRIWVTPGRGGFSPIETSRGEAAMYVLCLSDTYDIDRTKAWNAVVSRQPLRPTYVSPLLGNQNLLTTVEQIRANTADADVAIFVDEEGFVQHAAGYTLCILTQSDLMVIPPYDAVGPSITLQRMLELIPDERIRSPNDVVVRDVVQRKLHVSEVTAAKEAFVVNTTYTIAAIGSVDGVKVADGCTGVSTLALHYTLDNDATPPPRQGMDAPRHTLVPYGYTTGMRSQLV
ncbi:hypothetical protein HYH03_001473 [Edaphochlamys debaryana]|uniref:Uncharacterized protein n=1 Tax=Edaphochlamys debaryana TaxID=47281 RepID=A0A835YGC6_9CHLO|nr:hypothetical protein HYH03_001473 [Edaphochlamys debaryana]|eukprot:KAG2500708.1 hypothetical protein HYH03_001473 [Edaphochlamys debaryana]